MLPSSIPIHSAVFRIREGEPLLKPRESRRCQSPAPYQRHVVQESGGVFRCLHQDWTIPTLAPKLSTQHTNRASENKLGHETTPGWGNPDEGRRKPERLTHAPPHDKRSRRGWRSLGDFPSLPRIQRRNGWDVLVTARRERNGGWRRLWRGT